MKNELRVIFAGTPQNSAQALHALYSSGVNIAGVLTRKDAISGRRKQARPSAVAETAEQLGLELFKTNVIDSATQEWLSSLKADVGVVVAYGIILNRAVLDLPRLGWINLHYSLLPNLPGPAPVQHALLSGLDKTGVTIFRLDEGIDTGPIVTQETVAINDFDNAGSLISDLTEVGIKLLQGVISAGDTAIVGASTQKLIENVRYASKPSRKLAKLDFNDPASYLANKVRAMNPEPMAWMKIGESDIRVIRARSIEANSLKPSHAVLIDKELVVFCNPGALVLELVQPAGKNQMSGSDWFRGLRVDELIIS